MRSFLQSCRFSIVIAGCAALAACVDSPSAPLTASVDSNPLATSFDGLADEQTQAGDQERSEDFHWAALAVRAGVAPTRFDISNDGVRQTYDAFAQSVEWIVPTLSLRPVGNRTFVAWRKDGDAMQVLVISTHTDVAPVLHPYSMRPVLPGGVLASPVAGASAGFFERGSKKAAWVGISGQVKFPEKSIGAACAPPTAHAPPNGVKCTQATFGVGFDITMAKTRDDKSRVVDLNAPTRKFSAPDQAVAGVKLVFSCLLPLGDKGCG